VKLEQFFVSPDFSMQSFFGSLCSLAFAARGRDESTLMTALDAAGAGVATVAFDLPLAAEETGILFLYLCHG